MWHARGFCFSDDLEEETGFVWNGRYTYIYTDSDGYAVLAQVRDWTTEDGESRQQTHYFHCDKIGIPREMTDKDGNLLWYGEYTAWGRLKEESKVTDSVYQPFRLQTSMPTVKPDCITTSLGITSLMRGGVTHWGYLFQQSFIWEKKGKHIAEHNNFIPGRSILTANPQDLLEVVLIRIQEMRLRQNGE